MLLIWFAIVASMLVKKGTVHGKLSHAKSVCAHPESKLDSKPKSKKANPQRNLSLRLDNLTRNRIILWLVSKMARQEMAPLENHLM